MADWIDNLADSARADVAAAQHPAMPAAPAAAAVTGFIDFDDPANDPPPSDDPRLAQTYGLVRRRGETKAQFSRRMGRAMRRQGVPVPPFPN